MISRYALKILSGNKTNTSTGIILPDQIKGFNKLFVYNGSTAFDILLKSLNASGKKILLPRLTCSYVHDVVSANKAIPIYVDFESKLEPDIEDYKRAMTLHLPDIILVISYFGKASTFIQELRGMMPAQTFFIKDCALSYGASVNGLPDGTDADAAFYSFGEGKPLFCAGGGLLIYTDKIKVSTKLQVPSFFMQLKSVMRYSVKSMIMNSRILYLWFYQFKKSTGILSPGSGSIKTAYAMPGYAKRNLEKSKLFFGNLIKRNNGILKIWQEQFSLFDITLQCNEESNGMYTVIMLPAKFSNRNLQNILNAKGYESVIPYEEYFEKVPSVNWLLLPSMQAMSEFEIGKLNTLLLGYFTAS